ncbi:hypothetical protein evm_007772 [Chilo suppressalis]|nr:hypothetical protein evm_007772 [Chilo suppressalis]
MNKNFYSVSDADVFCFISNFSELTKIDVEKIGSDDQQFDALYLLIKVANNFSGLIFEEVSDDIKLTLKKKPNVNEKEVRKPIIMADGLAALDIVMSMSKNMSSDVFFCPTGIPDVTKSILAEYLKVDCNEINDVLIWAANDEDLHVEVEKPIIIHDKNNNTADCAWTMISEDLLRSIDYDHTQFNSSWMKKEFIQKVAAVTSKNPYGCIYKASVFCNALKSIWDSRKSETGKLTYCNLGVISDGSLGTFRGYPYVLPLVLSRDKWSVNKKFEEDVHVQNEIKRINKIVKKQHELLLPYCKRFLQENVINQAFIPPSESNSNYSVGSSSKSSV